MCYIVRKKNKSQIPLYKTHYSACIGIYKQNFLNIVVAPHPDNTAQKIHTVEVNGNQSKIYFMFQDFKWLRGWQTMAEL